MAAFSAAALSLIALGAAGAMLVSGNVARMQTPAAAMATDAPSAPVIAQAAVLTPRITMPAQVRPQPDLQASGADAGSGAADTAPVATASDPTVAATSEARIAAAFRASQAAQNPQAVGGETTAATPAAPQKVALDVPVAETEAQAEALEAQMARTSPDFAPLGAKPLAKAAPADSARPASQVASTQAAAAPAASSLREATVTISVNLHAGPDNKSKVLAVVPANASVEASSRCPVWCEVEFKGQRGYIFKTFVK